MAPARITVNGRELIAYGSKDYLGLANDQRVKEAAIRAIERYGTGSGSRALAGTLDLHGELEQALSEFMGTQTALVFSGGYLANIAILTGLLHKNGTVFIDEKVHASIIDGCSYSGAKVVPFHHNSVADLERKVRSVTGNRRLIVVDGVYSVEGDLALVPEITDVAAAHGIPVMVDDAHGYGAMGPEGRGTVAHFGLTDRIPLQMGTMSGVFGGFGGFLGSERHVGDYLRHSAKAFLFTTSLPAATTAGALEALRIMRSDASLHAKLWSNVVRLREGLRELGYELLGSESAITSIVLGNEHVTYKVVRLLEEYGIYVNAFVRPAVKKGDARIRLAVTAAHSGVDIDRTFEAFKKLRPLVEAEVAGYWKNR